MVNKINKDWHLRGKKIVDMNKTELLEVVQHLANESVDAKKECMEWQLGYKRLPLIKVGDEYRELDHTEVEN